MIRRLVLIFAVFSLAVAGTVAPGFGLNNTAVLTITGDYTQNAGGLLVIELEGTTPGSGTGFHDQLNVTDLVSLDGGLTVTEVNGFSAVAFNTFQVVVAGTSLTGTFNVGALSLPATFASPPTYGATFVDLFRPFVATIPRFISSLLP